MDPDANLQEQRELLESIQRQADEGFSNPSSFCQEAERLADLVEALDRWLYDGGALPSRWGR